MFSVPGLIIYGKCRVNNFRTTQLISILRQCDKNISNSPQAKRYLRAFGLDSIVESEQAGSDNYLNELRYLHSKSKLFILGFDVRKFIIIC